MTYNYPGWEGFEGGTWTKEIHIRSFIRHNYEPYDGNEDFLEAPTENTCKLWEQVCELFRKEREAGGVLDMDTEIISTITSHAPGYIDKDREKIVGLQTDKPLKRAFMPYGGIRTAERACTDNGYEIDPKLREFFTVHRKTHNAGVFDVYTPEMRACRSSHIITGLPDAYGRGRIIGDYRRVALYGVDFLIRDKQEEKRPPAPQCTPILSNSARSLPSRYAPLKTLKRWRCPTALTYPSPHATPRRLSSGSISAILPR